MPWVLLKATKAVWLCLCVGMAGPLLARQDGAIGGVMQVVLGRV